jgi:hypothetical protein
MAATRLAHEPRSVIAGVDTHLDVHVAAVVDEVGRTLGTREFRPTQTDTRSCSNGFEATAIWSELASRELVLTAPAWPDSCRKLVSASWRSHGPTDAADARRERVTLLMPKQ